jgi:hypothetical protein
MLNGIGPDAMPVMDKLRMCAEKMGYRLDVPPEFEKAIDEAYDSVFEDEEKSETKSSS